MKRWLALLISIVGGAVLGYALLLAVGGAVLGFMWIYVFGDDPWPAWSDYVLGRRSSSAASPAGPGAAG